ncbi:23S rRNA (adenine(2030)-N(6))-methyltransferase RlmJ [Gracilinema caldarium]|nr:23S rRNA (adenine(2030)-N(6))-methyltransferase RlmJ [Gracilinema caldarium]
MIQKDVPLLYMDTHAGSGAYSLHSGYATQNEEWRTGFQRLLDYPGPIPASIQQFKDFLEQCIADCGRYPGSPLIADRILRTQDRRVFYELHPTDYEALQQYFEGSKQVSILRSDGFEGIKAFLPPPSRRACIFIDPSYEMPSDYGKVVAALKEGLRRFATGTYIIWYPLLAKETAQALPKELLSLYPGNRLHVEIQTEHKRERGMYGSGLVLLNPPWALQQLLPEAIPVLTKILRETGSELRADGTEDETSPSIPACRFQFFT